MMTEKYGEWAFLLGVLLALVVGVFSAGWVDSQGIGLVYIYAVLVLLGLVVGLLNIKEKEINSFLLATIALMVASITWEPITALFTQILGEFGSDIVSWMQGFFGALVSFVSPAAFVVALKSIYNLASRPK